MVNILLFSPSAIENGRGGEISSMELAAGLSQTHRVTFVDTNRITSKKLLNKQTIIKKLEGVKKTERIRFAYRNIFQFQTSFPLPTDLLRLIDLAKRNDIIYSSISNIKMTLIWIFISLIHRKAKFIIGYRKPLYSSKIFSLYNIKYRISLLLLSLFRKRFYHHALSDHAANFLTNFFEKKKVIHIIHGINLDDYKDDSIDEKRKDILNFIYVGYLDDVHKGVKILIESIKEVLDEGTLKDIRFDIYGKGPLEEEVKAFEKEYPIYVKFRGYISNELVSNVYKQADVYLFTSRREPFPRVLMEALAANLIVICSQTIGSIELLNKKDFAFFLPELTPIALKNKIYKIYNLWIKKEEKFKKLQKNAKSYVFQNYSFQRELEIFNNLINQIGRS